MTVDLEDWFVVENLRDAIAYELWEKLPPRIEKNTARLLNLFAAYDVSATFFTLGWIAEKFPDLIYTIASFGHEIGCHSYQHRPVDSLTPEEFRKDTEKAQEAIFKACGVRPIGYRAPTWSINESNLWALDILADLDFMYDSSMNPIMHDIYGIPGGQTHAFKFDTEGGRTIYEIPATALESTRKRSFPVGGGGFLRLTSLWFTKRLIRRVNKKGRPVVVYIHPWEFDKNQPRLKQLSALQRLRQYGSIAIFRKKLELLLQKFEFYTAREYVQELKRKPIGFER